jgi:NAD-dependent DNA ligase|tara:strand:- start:2551 stop:3300 length:750 start_codon:yes stop_codon:yes gene_type:complete
MREIVIPTECPSCNTSLKLVKDILYCYNDHCPAKWDKKVEGFAKHLKIKGLGPSTIQKLELQDFHDIYSLEEPVISSLLNSEALGSKLWKQIALSTDAGLEELLPAFGIPLVGRSVASKICTQVEHISQITWETCRLAGLGPKATQNLINWINDEFYPYEYDKLPFSFKTKQKSVKEESKGVVCITGKLKSYPSKSAAQAVLEKAGYTVKSSVTNAVTILINESGIDSAKTNNARAKGVRIITNIKEII